jgi:hypothetical protein
LLVHGQGQNGYKEHFMRPLSGEVIIVLTLLLLVAAIGTAIYGISWFAKRTPPAQPNPVGPAGVGGWLLFLVVMLIFLGPFLGATRIAKDLDSAESQNATLKTLEAWGTYKTAIWLTFLTVSCLSFYAGAGLAKGRDSAVVNRAKFLLWVIGPLSALTIESVIPRLVFGRVEWNPDVFQGFFLSIIGAAMWTAYLSKSKRVRATYGTGPHQASA